jgi:hypothetical protein
MKKNFLLLPLILVVLTGCSIFGKEVRLKPVETVLSPSKKLAGRPVNLVVEDAREIGDPARIGSGSIFFASVTTPDDVPEWIEDSLWAELERAGCIKSRAAGDTVRVEVKEVYASLLPFVLSSGIELGIEVSSDKKVLLSEDLAAGTAPFSVFYTASLYENTLGATLAEWKRLHMPDIVEALEAAAYKKPEKPKPKPPVDRRVLAVGLSEFKNIPGRFTGKESAEGFAGAIRRALPADARSKIETLHNDSAGYAAVFRKLADAFAATGKDETCVVFYSGKTFLARGDLLMAAHDTDPEKITTGGSLGDLALHMSGHFRGESVLLIIHSPEPLGKEETAAMQKAVARDKRLSILAIAGTENPANAVSGKADSDRDGHVSISELQSHVKKQNGQARLFGLINEDFLLR